LQGPQFVLITEESAVHRYGFDGAIKVIAILRLRLRRAYRRGYYGYGYGYPSYGYAYPAYPYYGYAYRPSYYGYGWRPGISIGIGRGWGWGY